MNVLILFLMLFLWAETRVSHCSPLHSDGKIKKKSQDYEKKRNKTRTEETEGEALNEMDFYNAKFINISSLDKRTHKVDGDPLLLTGLFEGEMDNRSDIGIFERNGVGGSGSHFPHGIIPYSIANTFDDEARILFARTISEFYKKTCLRFVPKTSAHKSYIDFMDGTGCSLSADRPKGVHNISLAKGCLQFGTIVHEVMHAFGFGHEHNRPDRDDYITIVWDNIQPGTEYTFDKGHWDKDILYNYTFNEPYDYDSVMHYPTWAFARKGTNQTIIPKVKGKFIGQVHGFSPTDLRKINNVFHCKKEKAEALNGTGSDCADADGRCAAWAKQGQCDKVPDWMRPNCLRSCGVCQFSMGCNDQSDKCPEWSKKGLCDTNQKFMKIFCLKSCKVCPLA